MIAVPPVCDLAAVPQVARRLSAAIEAESGAGIVVDGARARVVDETLPGLLSRDHRRLDDQAGRMAVVAPADSPLRQAIEQSGASGVLSLFESRPAALDWVHPARVPQSLGLPLAAITTRRTSATTVLVLRGEWDISNVATLEAALAVVLEEPVRELVVDLSEVGFVDLRVVACLSRAQRSALAGNVQFAVLAPRPAVRRAIRSMHAEDLLDGTVESHRR